MCSNICSDFLCNHSSLLHPLSCVGGRSVGPSPCHWCCCMARVISKQILNNSWAGSGPMTPSCATYSVMLSEYIHIYVQCVSPFQKLTRTRLASSATAEREALKDDTWTGREREDVMLPEWINSGHVENTFQWQFCQCESSFRRQSANPADDQTKPSPGQSTVLVVHVWLSIVMRMKSREMNLRSASPRTMCPGRD